MNPTRCDYFRELRPFLFTTVLLFTLGIIAGSLLAGHSTFAGLKINESVGGFAQVFANVPKPILALMIFTNNAVKTLVVIVLGIALAIVPLAFILVNGVAIGVVLHLATQSKGLAYSILAIVPHGVFELPGVLCGAAIGVMLGSKAAKRLFRKSEFKVGFELRRALKIFAAAIVPLLVIGAITEAYLTAAILGK
ncbi:MAG TPA: stage II sporulation protein M [Candidatus Polarisedimenticolaceae bacterium]|nr:stage II sporulation protein M [Candidatus Polarisedimenticolaceae bacterium]